MCVVKFIFKLHNTELRWKKMMGLNSFFLLIFYFTEFIVPQTVPYSKDDDNNFLVIAQQDKISRHFLSAKTQKNFPLVGKRINTIEFDTKRFIRYRSNNYLPFQENFPMQNIYQ